MLGAPIDFPAANFRHAFMWARKGVGDEPILKWLPYGMPRFNQPLLSSVFFLYRKGAKPNERDGPFGTGVIVGATTFHDRFRILHYYAVTAHHIQDKHRAYEIRINTRDGNARYIDIDASDWHSEVGGPDLAATDVTEHVGPGNDFFSYVPVDMFCTEAFIREREVGIGEDGFMIGLFSDLPGKEKNMIAGRFGNVALMADPDAKVKLSNNTHYPVHLFDIRSRPGFSGSPVWVYRVPTNDLRETEGPNFNIDANNRFMRLLGIHVSQYSDMVDEIEVVRKPGKKPSPQKTGKQLQIPNSVTIVIPAWEIVNLLNHQTFKDQRGERQMKEQSRRLTENTPIPEAIPVSDAKPEPAATKGDERHKERFTALLDEAVGKPRRGD